MSSLQGKTRIPYTPPGLPGASERFPLFSTTTAFGPRCAVHYQCYTFNAAVTVDQNFGQCFINLEKSDDGGSTWVAVTGAGTSISAINPTTFGSIFVRPYQDWRTFFINGATPQTTFLVEMSIDHTCR